MIVYIIIFSIIFLMGIFLNLENNKNKKIYVIMSFGLMTIVSALRKYTIGIDMELLYYPKYIQIANLSFNNLLDSIHLEKGYLYFCKILTFISEDPQFLIIVTSLITIPVVGWFIYKNSKNVRTSTLLYIFLCLFFMTMNIVRQEIAVSIVLIAYYMWKKNKKIRSICMIIFASLFHTSALICILPMFLYGKKFKKKYFYISFLIVIILLGTYKTLLGGYSTVSNELNLSNNKDYSIYLESDKYGSGNINLNSISTCLLSLVIYCLGYYYIVVLNKNDKSNDSDLLINQNFLLFMAMGYMCVNIVSLKMVIIARLSYYFIPFILLIIPEFIELSNNKENKRIIRIVMYFFVIAKFLYVFIYLADVLYGVMPYKFFWQ